MRDDFDTLVSDLTTAFSAGVAEPWSDDRFNALAMRAFGHQLRTCSAFRGLCEARGATQSTVSSWAEIPAVPTRAFKHLDLIAGDAARTDAIFRTSGTTAGTLARGRHLVRSLPLYRASLLPPFRAHVVPEGTRIPFISLVPAFGDALDSSLSYMVTVAAEELSSSVDWCVRPDGALDVEGFRSAVGRAIDKSRPVLILGTAFALVHLMEALALDPVCALPEGSRVMETGGFKGRVRSVAPAELYAGVSASLGVPTARIVNEYGMTELLSQLYEPVLAEGESARRHVPPPWLRVQALDPSTLEPLGAGEPGLLAFFDLANAGSVCHILTEDMGTVEPDGVRLRGRVQGAEPRGCSRAMDELLQ